MNINTDIRNHGKVSSGKVGSQYNHAKILELGTGLDGWDYAMMKGLGWELRSTDGPVRYHWYRVCRINRGQAWNNLT